MTDLRIFRALEFNELARNEIKEWKYRGLDFHQAARQIDLGSDFNEDIAVGAGDTAKAEIITNQNYSILVFFISILAKTGSNPFVYNENRLRIQISDSRTDEELFRNPLEVACIVSDSERQFQFPIPILMVPNVRHTITIYNDDADNDIVVRFVYHGVVVMDYL